MDRPIIVGLGEVLWDVYPDIAHFGGAPANFACHSAALGAEAYIISRVGNDELGQRAKKILEQKSVITELLQIDHDRPTGTVQVTINEVGHPDYQFANDTAWDCLKWNNDVHALARKCDAVCFGTLGQRSLESRETIRRFVHSTNKNCYRVLDVNLRQNFYDAESLEESFRLASFVKLNDQELIVVCDLLGITYAGEQDAIICLADLFSVRTVALTKGENGSILFHNRTFDIVTPPEIIAIDTVGAGDAFTAALVLGFLKNEPITSIHQRASRIASFVCTQRGATPALPAEELLPI